MNRTTILIIRNNYLHGMKQGIFNYDQSWHEHYGTDSSNVSKERNGRITGILELNESIPSTAI